VVAGSGASHAAAGHGAAAAGAGAQHAGSGGSANDAGVSASGPKAGTSGAPKAGTNASIGGSGASSGDDAGMQPSAAGTGGAGTGAAGSDAAVVDPSDVIFDLTKLHDVRVTVADSDLDNLRNNRDARIAATLYFDGQQLNNIVAHRKGFTTGNSTKPSLVLDLDDTVKNQNLDGLSKVVVNNAIQDPSFLDEHLAYEFVRKAGLPAPRTAHAVVTLNGEVLGLYILEEDLNKAYLSRWFGSKNKSGNLYEGSLQDFAVDQTEGTWPQQLDLKNEAEEGRTRDDVIALANLVNTVSDADFATMLDASMNFDSFVTAFAIDMITGSWDDYYYGSNNYYLYHNPADNRFVLLLHGMDFLFSPESAWPTANPDATVDPFVPLASFMSGSGPGRVAARLRAIPALETRLHGEVGRLIRTVWDVDALTARIDQVSTMLHTNTNTDPILVQDIANFDKQRPIMVKLLTDRKTYMESVTQ
jgi:spore coat protein H